MWILFAPVVFFLVLPFLLPSGRPFAWVTGGIAAVLVLLAATDIAISVYAPPAKHGDALGLALLLGLLVWCGGAFAVGVACSLAARALGPNRTDKRDVHAADNEP